MSSVLLRDLGEFAAAHRASRPARGQGDRLRLGGAGGESDAWSDLDLIIVAETARPFFERHKDFSGLFSVWPRLDLLIHTPAEFEALVAEERPIVMQALHEGVVLHPTTQG